MAGRYPWTVLATFLLGCAPVVEAEFSRIDVSRPDIQIPASPSASVSSVTFNFAIESSKLGASSKPDTQDNLTEVTLHRLALTAKGGIADLSFIKTLHALACVPISKTSSLSSRQVEIADYARPAQDTSVPSATFEVPLPEPVDLLPLLRPLPSEAKRILVIVNLGGQLPTTEWKADVAMSLSVSFRQ